MSRLSEILGCVGFGLALSATAVNAVQSVEGRKQEIKLDYLFCIWGTAGGADTTACIAEHQRKYGRDAIGRPAKPPAVPEQSPSTLNSEG